MRLLRNLIFSSLTLGLIIAVACTKLGPVPDFEYTYDFKPTLPDVNIGNLAAETISITDGNVDVSEYSNLSSSISNPVAASNYAAAGNSTFSAAQKTYWLGQTQSSILAALLSENSTAQAQVASAINSLTSNPTLSALVPRLTSAAGNLTSGSGRLGFSTRKNMSGTFDFHLTQFFLVQTQELDDCRQAANDAFNTAQTAIDDLLSTQLQSIQDQYAAQLPLIESQRASLETGAQDRHTARLDSYLSIFNTTATTISSLFGAGSISAAERDNLIIVNIATYAASVNSSITLLNSELDLIDALIAQATANLIATRDSLITLTNNNYNAELARLTQLRDSTISSCHNQGGTNVS